MNTVILVRHCQSDHHIRDITGGWTDAPLTDLGRMQAQRLGKRLKRLLEDQPARLFSSDLSRAAETAQIIGRICAFEPRFYEELRELNNGQAKDLSRLDAKLIEQPITDPVHDWVPYPGAESWRMMANRVYGFLELLHPLVADTAIFVTHGNTGVAAIQWWLGLEVPCVPAISFQLDPASITILGINFWNERTIVKLNDTSHLHGLPSDGINLLAHEDRNHL
jgi:probable phosphoglycerate mutase